MLKHKDTKNIKLHKENQSQYFISAYPMAQLEHSSLFYFFSSFIS